MIKQVTFNLKGILFVGLSILIFCNLNGMLNNLFGIEAALSPLILLFTILLFLVQKMRIQHFSFPIVLFLTTLVSLYGIGLFSGFFYMGETNFDISSITDSTRKTFTSILIFLVFAIYTSSLTAKERTRCIKFILIVFLFTSLIGVFESLFGLRVVSPMNTSYDTERTLGFFGNPNLTGLQANFTLSLILGLFIKRVIGLFFILLTMPIALYASIASFSKSSIITSGLLILLFLVFNIKNGVSFNNPKKSIPALKFLSILFFSTIFFIIPIAQKYYTDLNVGQQKRLKSAFNLVVKGEFNRKTTSKRSAIFSDGIKIIKRNPVVGHGLYTFSKGGMFKSSKTHGIHNTYLKLIGEGGFIPLLSFLLFGLSITYLALKSNNETSIAALFIIISFFLYAFSSHNTMEDKFAVALLGSVCGFFAKK